MIEVSRGFPVNDGTQPSLSVDEVWSGLVEKAENPLPYVASITECSVGDRFEGAVVRDVIHVGQPVRGVVTFYPKQRVQFMHTRGAVRGSIDNKEDYLDAVRTTLQGVRTRLAGAAKAKA